MTNRKLKNVQRNLRIREVICDNAVNLFSTAVCLHTMGESKSRISAMLQEYHDETVPEYEKLAAEDVQHASVIRGLTAIGMEFEQALSCVRERCPEQHPKFQQALAENLGILLMQINHTFGYGQKRLTALLDMTAKYKGDARSEAKKLFGLNFIFDEQELPDVDALAYKKPKLSYSEQRRLSADMEAVRAIQNCRR